MTGATACASMRAEKAPAPIALANGFSFSPNLTPLCVLLFKTPFPLEKALFIDRRNTRPPIEMMRPHRPLKSRTHFATVPLPCPKQPSLSTVLYFSFVSYDIYRLHYYALHEKLRFFMRFQTNLYNRKKISIGGKKSDVKRKSDFLYLCYSHYTAAYRYVFQARQAEIHTSYILPYTFWRIAIRLDEKANYLGSFMSP